MMSTPITKKTQASEQEDQKLWIEEVDEVMFQPTEIVPNSERAYKPASDLQQQIEEALKRGER
ncbi:hypothetical protein ACQR0Z_33385 [Bradyrhizobium sp. HKCCYLS3077]|uniref:hypothetical protein n=1 Tax=Bradyrhizobium sp. HKCCYLS3077 TaxID=3420761 RepID=UPI003EB90C57